MDKRSKGQQAEQLALTYLKNQGLKFIKQNYHSKFGELDLVMQDRQTLVFIEVRFRKNKQFGHSVETINLHKQKRILKTAVCFLKQTDMLDKKPCRFDVVAISMSAEQPEISWIKDAFRLDLF